VKQASLAASLLRPFIDLEPCPVGPLYARGLEHSWDAFAHPDRPRFALQRTLPHPFRRLLLAEVDRRDHDGADPRAVADGLRTPRWRALCEALDAWPALTTDQRCRLVRLLHALCFYAVVVEQVPAGSRTDDLWREDGTELAYWRASASYVLGLPDRVADYGAADLTAFEHIAAEAPTHEPAAFDAAVKLLTHHAKTGAPAGVLARWQTLAEKRLASAAGKLDDFSHAILRSRLHRASAFVPQSAHDRRAVVRVMDEAERQARAAVPIGEAQRLRYLENLHPILESRVKEALWLGELDLALERARAVVDLDTFDSRAWLELGQVRMRRGEWATAAEVYATAAMLGPPSSAIGRHMAGQCFDRLGQPLLAAYFFGAALDADPRGTSPREAIQALPDLPVLTALKGWSLASFAL
jgi:tetratricopeptide (TPR) repeat protein